MSGSRRPASAGARTTFVHLERLSENVPSGLNAGKVRRPRTPSRAFHLVLFFFFFRGPKKKNKKTTTIESVYIYVYTFSCLFFFSPVVQCAMGTVPVARPADGGGGGGVVCLKKSLMDTATARFAHIGPPGGLAPTFLSLFLSFALLSRIMSLLSTNSRQRQRHDTKNKTKTPAPRAL